MAFFDATTAKKYNGTTFYLRYGDRLKDYSNLLVDPSSFKYTSDQRTLILGECDFSFTSSLINKRGSTGINICSTSWYYENTQWYGGLQSNIGSKQFNKTFVNNLKYCINSKCRITFGVDVKSLIKTEIKWNDNLNYNNNNFDRIIFTFPEITNSNYNNSNEMLILNILNSCRIYLKNDNKSELHIMLLDKQFFNWNINKLLKQFGLYLAYYCELNPILLKKYFPNYTPRDCYGNVMQLGDDTVYYCSFKLIYYNNMISPINASISPISAVSPSSFSIRAPIYIPNASQYKIHYNNDNTIQLEANTDTNDVKVPSKNDGKQVGDLVGQIKPK